jgi:RNA polymerase sporulation-specific sigma factor
MTGEDRDDGASVPATDEALAARALGGDPDALMALLTRYRWMLRSLARRYFLPGGDVEGLIQEASLGFVRAVRDYRPQLGIPFRPFAELCAARQVITGVKSATRQNTVASKSCETGGAEGSERGHWRNRGRCDMPGA